MLVAKLLPFTENLSSRKWSDPDITEDIEYLNEKLQENFQSLTQVLYRNITLVWWKWSQYLL